MDTPDRLRHNTQQAPPTSREAEMHTNRGNIYRTKTASEAPDSMGPKIHYESPPKKITPNMIPENNSSSGNRNSKDPFYANNKFDIDIHRRQLESLNMLSKSKH